ncbi:GNAT family N-acetyltransferase [Macrococcus brunensis]|uniref:GNAT family N-acetyltransferase n=1 Tax=Macrococcus brunensis TaxID=198483 RepID=UPI001EF15732|nr:GNAT family N-acetyltransferase [Macrococcus brunensis]ULG71907.1 GNAT family N-acetyltransferase [Macrococcus brunensis]
MYKFRNVKTEDLDRITELEGRAFIPEVADTKEAFRERIEKISDTFIVAEDNNEVVGFINGPIIKQPYITDDLFKKVPDTTNGEFLSVLGLVVAETHQGQGLAGLLLDRFTKRAEKLKTKSITLTCIENLVPFYERYGFESHGPSRSQHGGEQWLNMVKSLDRREQ